MSFAGVILYELGYDGETVRQHEFTGVTFDEVVAGVSRSNGTPEAHRELLKLIAKHAVEIERLRKDKAGEQVPAEYIEWAESTIERLRTALKRIYGAPTVAHAMDIARAALKEDRDAT